MKLSWDAATMSRPSGENLTSSMSSRRELLQKIAPCSRYDGAGRRHPRTLAQSDLAPPSGTMVPFFGDPIEGDAGRSGESAPVGVERVPSPKSGREKNGRSSHSASLSTSRDSACHTENLPLACPAAIRLLLLIATALIGAPADTLAQHRRPATSQRRISPSSEPVRKSCEPGTGQRPRTKAECPYPR